MSARMCPPIVGPGRVADQPRYCRLMACMRPSYGTRPVRMAVAAPRAVSPESLRNEYGPEHRPSRRGGTYLKEVVATYPMSVRHSRRWPSTLARGLRVSAGIGPGYSAPDETSEALDDNQISTGASRWR
jgi:hypothetical protein